MDFSFEYLFASMLIGTIGFSLFIYGKKQQRIPQIVTGIALMVYPYFIENVWWMWGIGGSLIAGLWIATKNGL